MTPQRIAVVATGGALDAAAKKNSPQTPLIRILFISPS
jgi:hypothetical protein